MDGTVVRWEYGWSWGRGDKWKRRGVEGEEFSDRFES